MPRIEDLNSEVISEKLCPNCDASKLVVTGLQSPLFFDSVPVIPLTECGQEY